MGEAVAITVQLLTRNTSFTTHHENIYVLSELLLWLLMFLSLWGSQNHKWYPYCGTWVLTIVFDLAIVALSSQAGPPKAPVEWTQIALHSVRVLLTLLLLMLCLGLRSSGFTRDEEASPLLKANNGRASDAASEPTRYGSVDSDASGVAAEAEDEVIAEEKKFQERMDRLKERVKEKGNYLTYIKGFSVSRRHELTVLEQS